MEEPSRFEYGTDFPYYDEMFIGRKQELDFLKRSFSSGTRIIIVEGAAGVGKTSLAKYFIQKESRLFQGGVGIVYAYSELSLREFIESHAAIISYHERALLVVEEAHNLSVRCINELKKVLDEYPKICFLLVGRPFADLTFTSMKSMKLNGLSQEEFVQWVKSRLGKTDYRTAQKLYSLVSGHPLASQMLISSLGHGTIKLNELFVALQDFRASGIIGPDGESYDPIIKPSEKLILSVTEVNDELLTRLKDDPELLRKVSPRKFEGIIAELLTRQGYRVELTPATRDGGFDMYAAKSDTLGRFLFLVECKRYTPPSKVGVQVIRSLYGVLQQSKATAGIIATTSFFTSAAKEFQNEVKYQISLQDFLEIKKWLGLI